jgi:hypothetical protein
MQTIRGDSEIFFDFMGQEANRGRPHWDERNRRCDCQTMVGTKM